MSNEIQKETWVRLTDQLPPANVEVEWYDAMFGRNMIFALEDPSKYDGDFTHWKPCTPRPVEFQEPPHNTHITWYYRDVRAHFIKANTRTWLGKINDICETKTEVLSLAYYSGARQMLRIIRDDYERMINQQKMK